MRILHVIPGIAPRYGGPSAVIRSLCESLSQLPDMAVELATTDADGSQGRISNECVPVGFPVHVFPRTWSERWKYSGELSEWLNQNVRDFDAVHIHAIWTHSSAAAARAARKAGVPYLVRPAGMLSTYSIHHRAVIKRVSWWFIERSVVKHAAAFHATSDAEADDIRNVWPEAKVFVVPNGVDKEGWQIPRDRESLRRRIGAEKDSRSIVLFLSRLHPKKGIVDLLLPAIASMTQRPLLVLAGGIDEHSRSYGGLIEDSIRRLQIGDSVKLTGSIEPSARWNFFDGADVFVLPSHSENFGIAVVEAMARRLPVIVSDKVQICDHVKRAKAGLVVPINVQAIAQAIQDLLSNAACRNDMGAAGERYAREHFSWPAIASQTADIYRSMLSGPSV